MAYRPRVFCSTSLLTAIRLHKPPRKPGLEPSRTLPPPEQPARCPVCLIRFKPHLLREALPA